MTKLRVGDSIELRAEITDVYNDGSFFININGRRIPMTTETNCVVKYIPKPYEPKIGDVFIRLPDNTRFTIKAIDDGRVWLKYDTGSFVTFSLEYILNPLYFRRETN